MVTREPSVTPRNEAAERLRVFIGSHTDAEILSASADLDAAFRTERLRIVEQIKERLGPMGPTYDEPWNRVAAILDVVAGLTGEEPSDG